MQNTIQIEAKMVGQKRPLSLGEPLVLPDDQPVTLRELIESVVRREVDAFRTRQADRRLLRVLTEADIEAGQVQGKFDMGQHEVQAVDTAKAIKVAVQAFQDGLYYAFIDDQQYESLDQVVPLCIDSRLTFIRLMPLAGG